jgi:hypothetical protein
LPTTAIDPFSRSLIWANGYTLQLTSSAELTCGISLQAKAKEGPASDGSDSDCHQCRTDLLYEDRRCLSQVLRRRQKDTIELTERDPTTQELRWLGTALIYA